SVVGRDQILDERHPAHAQRGPGDRPDWSPDRAAGSTTAQARAQHRKRVADAVAQLVEPTTLWFGLRVRVGGEGLALRKTGALGDCGARTRDQPAEEATFFRRHSLVCRYRLDRLGWLCWLRRLDGLR